VIRAELATVYGVVADVANYSNFVPFCENSTLSSDKSSGQIDIKFGPIRNSWQSKLTFSEGEILAQNATSFPLKYLDTRWKFTPRKNGITVVDLEIEYEFAKTLHLVEDVIDLESFSSQFVHAFKREAETVAKRARLGKK